MKKMKVLRMVNNIPVIRELLIIIVAQVGILRVHIRMKLQENGGLSLGLPVVSVNAGADKSTSKGTNHDVNKTTSSDNGNTIHQLVLQLITLLEGRITQEIQEMKVIPFQNQKVLQDLMVALIP